MRKLICKIDKCNNERLSISDWCLNCEARRMLREMKF
jgi:hypothetical protein